MSQPLRIPLEVLERILFFTFGGDLPVFPSLSSPPTPPRSTSHILQVSKGIRQLSLPLFFRSITILHSQDWIDLFHPETGVLGGEANEDRRSFIEEVRLNTNRRGQLPGDLERIKEYFNKEYFKPTGQHLSRLALQPETLPNVKHIVFFDHTLDSPPRPPSRKLFWGSPPSFRLSGDALELDTFARTYSAAFGQMVQMELRRERGEAFESLLLPPDQRTCLPSLHYPGLDDNTFNLRSGSYHHFIHARVGDVEPKAFQLQDGYGRLTTKPVVLVGFSLSSRTKLLDVLESKPFIPGRTSRPWNRAVKFWSWEIEDGSVVPFSQGRLTSSPSSSSTSS